MIAFKWTNRKGQPQAVSITDGIIRSIPIMAQCGNCNGTGWIIVTVEDERTETAKDVRVRCENCSGTGQV